MTFQIKENKNNYRKSFKWIIIDFDHILTRHYNGLKHHFQNIKPEKYHQGYQWDTDQVFLNELRVHIQKKIKSIISTNRINPKRVILINDNIQNDTAECMWRSSLWSEWTLKFKNDHYSCRLGSVRSQIFSLGLNYFLKIEEYTHFDYPNFEGDDIISIVTNSILVKYPNDSVFIVTNDSDFYQLISPRTTILNLDGVTEPERHYPTGLENLWFNIIDGKMSNKVPGIKFKKDLLKGFLGSHYDLDVSGEDNDEHYRKASRSEQHYLICNLEKTIKWITDTPGLIQNNQHIINQKIIDFKEIPTEYATNISESFWIKYYYVNSSSSYIYDKTFKNVLKTSSNPFAVLTVE